MLAHYIKKPHVIKRMHQSYFCYLFDSYVLHLHQRGYRSETIKIYCQCIEHFGQWLKKKNIAKSCISKIEMSYFLTKHLPICKCLTPRTAETKSIRAAIKQLLKLIYKDEAILSNDDNPERKILISYDSYLSDICGMANNTRIKRRRYVRAFLDKLKISNLSQVDKVSSKQIVRFVKEYSSYYKSGSIGVVLTSLRSFLKYVSFQGYNVKKLIFSIPRIPNWKLSTVPKFLTDKQIKTFLSVFNCKSPSGKRDYAMARCLTDLGLRCCEVSKLKLQDINWHEATIKIARGKIEQEDSLPLPKATGEAISDYLVHGRPKSNSKFIFVFHGAPYGKGVQTTTVRGAIRRAFHRAGFEPCHGTHILRHTFATRLLTSGTSLKEIADMLRHKCIDTTMIYTKVDLPHLHCVAMPWFGRKS
jgi:integrase/recombinase XerD